MDVQLACIKTLKNKRHLISFHIRYYSKILFIQHEREKPVLDHVLFHCSPYRMDKTLINPSYYTKHFFDEANSILSGIKMPVQCSLQFCVLVFCDRDPNITFFMKLMLRCNSNFAGDTWTKWGFPH